MIPTPTSGRSILRQEALGFSTLLFLIWLMELIHLPHLLFDEPATFSWSRVLLRTGVILAIWLWVHLANRRLLKRLRQLEEFLLICSWCRKVGHKGEWMTLEDYFGSHLNTETSHGICPECSRKQLATHRTTRVDKTTG